jgi:NTP pyrophosphatase (non-canonical NTP hydrolase)
MEFKELNEKVIEWADNKGILNIATPKSQLGKTKEEVEELTEALEAQDEGLFEFVNSKGETKNTDFEIEDSIGDILVTLIIQAKMQNIDIVKALELAYDTISKRTGKMVNGVFVKNK